MNQYDEKYWWVDVSWYGAKGDGVTDDTASIQAAIDTGAPTVYIGPGVYLITLIELNDGQSLIGAGPSATTLRLPNNCEGVESSAILGISCKSEGVESLTLAEFSYDGNESNNRNWVDLGLSYSALQAHGINFVASAGRLAPRHLVLRNLHIHDCVRSNILTGKGTETIDASGIRLRNSVSDHLIYSTGGSAGSWKNLILEGYWRGAAIVSNNGQSYDGLTFYNLSENPLRDLLGYQSNMLMQDRAGGASGSHWSNIVVRDADPQVTRIVLQPIGNGTTMRGVLITQDPDAAAQDGLFYLVSSYLDSACNIHVSDVAMIGVSEYTTVFLAQGGVNNHKADRVIIRGVTVSARDGAAIAGRYLIDIRTPCEGILVSDMLSGPEWELINNPDSAILTNCYILT